ncbi:MAG: tubulin-like doman-containing protein [Propionibacteriaceae bacterium]|jgi:hypothetical protein|nr:tubulin-like doman-containing protein [Propionibacteriaceae bacterium]
MRRFLAVGCGGSGAATLAYMRDHLSETLARRGWQGKLPAGWQFVVIDVPTGALSDQRPKTRPPAIGQSEGASGEGQYVSTGYPNGTYAMLDQALTTRLSAATSATNEGGGLKLFGSWAPRDPWAVNIALAEGAGQHRAIGRALLLQHVQTVQTALDDAVDSLEGAGSDMLRLNPFFPDDPYSGDPPLILVVSSMAGGSGASMALDVCRLLRANARNQGRQIAVFMISADVFSDNRKYSEDTRHGAMPNALAMLGEIVAAQMGESTAHDLALLNAAGADHLDGALLGAETELAVPFQRVFPVSNRIGGGVKLGDGGAEHIFRALGLGLGSLMVSGQTAVNDFVSIDLTNPPTPPNTKYFGWGARDATRLVWGSFGYASLSLGRDRYEHYAAQRLAGASVRNLLDGHLIEGLSSQESVNALAGRDWRKFWELVGLPTLEGGVAPTDEAGRWFEGVLGAAVCHQQASQVIGRVVAPRVVPPAGQAAGSQWLSAVDGWLADCLSPVVADLRQAAERGVYDWQQSLRGRTEAAVTQVIGERGLEYAAQLATSLSDWLPYFVGALRQIAAVPPHPLELGPELRATLGGLARIDVGNGTDARNEVLAQVTRESARWLQLTACAKTADLLESFVTDLLAPLIGALNDAQKGLRALAEESPSALGSADLRTSDVQAWPSDRVPLPQRFTQAVNEIVLTEAADFPAQYEADVRAAWIHNQSYDSRQNLTFEDAQNLVVGQIVTGQWEASGGQSAPGGLLTGFDTWWAGRVFPNDPFSGATKPIGEATVGVHVLPEEVLRRATALVRRPNDQAFSTYTSVTLNQWLQDPSQPHEQKRREDLLARKFVETLEKARPLALAEPRLTALANAVTEPRYRYRFSTIPFPPTVVARLTQLLKGDEQLDPTAVNQFTGSCSTSSDAQSVAVFGSYQPMAPIVFSGLLQPIADQYGRTVLPTARDLFWRWRRARPLGAAIPLSRAERHALAAGWFIGQITGHLLLPDKDRPNDSIKIWARIADGSGRWLEFPSPLLTPPGFHEGPYHFQPYDWLPAVLESILLAYARVPVSTLASLDPYIALRSLFDSGDKPSGGLDLPNLAARTILKAWATDGITPEGGASRVPRLAASTGPTQRIEAALAWLQGPKGPLDTIRTTFDPGPRGDAGRFAKVSTREAAAAMPLFADVAMDVKRAVEDIVKLLNEINDDDIEPPDRF